MSLYDSIVEDAALEWFGGSGCRRAGGNERPCRAPASWSLVKSSSSIGSLRIHRSNTRRSG